MKKLLALALAVVLALSVFAGCAAGGKKAELALITDIGTIDDKSFNQGAWEGLVKYAEEKGISHQYYQPTEKSVPGIHRPGCEERCEGHRDAGLPV